MATAPTTPTAPAAPASNHPLAPLLTPAGWALLDSLPAYGTTDPLTLSSRLRETGHDPALVSAALTQQRLRQRATAKFGPFAARMLFTPDGLEQATRLAVSAHHAARYAAAGVTAVADLGCGIGGDALALAGLGLQVLAVDKDEATAAVATVNLMPFETATVVHDDALAVAGPGGAHLARRGIDAVFADPARRAGGRRLSDPEAWSPALSHVLSLREHVPNLGVKIAPGIDHAALPADSHTQWVSVDGDVVEAAVWCGALAPEGPGRSALCLRSATEPTAEDDPDGSPVHAAVLTDPTCTDPRTQPVHLDPVTGAEALGTYFFEPDGAAIRAGLVAHLAEQLDARPVGARIAYLTGSRPAPAHLTPFLRAWRVREVLPMHLKTLRRHVREHGIGRLDIHKRGLDLSPDTLRASLRLSGPQSQTWAVTRLGADASGRPGRGAVVVLDPLH